MDKKYRYILVSILMVAALLRIVGLSRGDTINDEVFYAFRAIKLIDFDHAEFQTTPWEWWDPASFADCAAWLNAHVQGGTAGENAPQHCLDSPTFNNLSAKGAGWDPQIPSWTKLSFHDHPPLVFWIQHFFIKFLGENNFAFRFPSVLWGLASIYLLYLLGRLWFSPLTGLWAAGIYAVTVNHVALSRMGLQEPYVVFFMLLTLYGWFRALKYRKDNFFILAGISLGLGFLAKYNTFIVVPIFFTYLLFFRREYIFNKKLWLGLALAVFIFSPVIIYNIKLYQAVGHFDFQLSYIFGQHPAIWKVAPGKEVIGSLIDRIQAFPRNLLYTNSWLFLASFAGSLLAFLVNLYRRPKESFEKYAVLFFSILWITVLLLLIGPSFRFLTMLTPFMVLTSSVFLVGAGRRLFSLHVPYRLVFCAVGILAAFEIFYSINSQIFYYPLGPRILAWSLVRFENYNWGYNTLGKFLTQELEGKMPAYTMDSQYKFLDKLRDDAVLEDRARDLAPYPAVLIHYGNFDDGAKLWVLDRLATYHAWPVFSFKDYLKFLREHGEDYFTKAGFKHFYFIWQTNIVPAEEFRKVIAGIEPIVIVNKRGERAFEVYKKDIK